MDQGNLIFYASTETTAPSEAFYQWKIETSSSRSVYIRPEQRRRNDETFIPVFTTLLGQAGRNTFTLTSGKMCLLHVLYIPLLINDINLFTGARGQENSKILMVSYITLAFITYII